MPHVHKIIQSFKKQYGRKAESKYNQWLEERPEAARKALATARKKDDKIVPKFPQTRTRKKKPKS